MQVTVQHADSRKAVAAAFLVGLVLSAVWGCTRAGGEATADCQAQIRVDDRVYTSYGYTDQEATSFSVADQAECHDLGVDAEGSTFPDVPAQVAVWSFDGYPAEKVLGVRFDEDSFAVFVADSVSPAESDRIFKELGSVSKRL